MHATPIPPSRSPARGCTAWRCRSCSRMLVGLISLLPIFRSGFATVPGQNGDAILVVGTAVLLEHAPPTATRTDLPISRIPLEWRSKYPIYYPLAAVSTLGDQDPIAAFASFSALILALTALGFYLFARYALRAPPAAALLAMFIVPLDRIVMYVTMHPYYNELWGQFTLPFILLAGCRYLDAPDRRRAALLGLFLILGLLAYPLMLPFPALFLVGYAVVVWRRERRPDIGARAGSPRWRCRGRTCARGSGCRWCSSQCRWRSCSSAASSRRPCRRSRCWRRGRASRAGTGRRSASSRGRASSGCPGSGALDLHRAGRRLRAGVRGLSRVDRQVRWPLAAMVIATALIGVYFRAADRRRAVLLQGPRVPRSVRAAARADRAGRTCRVGGASGAGRSAWPGSSRR